MPLFSRSSDRNTKSKLHPFSLRKFRHHYSDADLDDTIIRNPTNHLDRRTRRQTQTGRVAEQTSGGVLSTERITTEKINSVPVPPSALSTSSTSSSALTLRSTSLTLCENYSIGENDTEISDGSEARESVATPPLGRTPSMRNSRHSASSRHFSLGSNRNSLADYRQLHCSMSYKNRVYSDSLRATSATSSSSESELSERMSDIRTSLLDGWRGTNTSIRSSERHSLLNARISESSTAITSTCLPSVHESASISSPAARLSEMSTSSDTAKLTEASVAALQTRRAFQQMVLSMQDEDSGDESDGDAWLHSSVESPHGSSNVVRLSADDYRKFQFRLRQLEELAAEQTRKHADMEQTIEQEVKARTQHVIEAMEKQISMYKQAKELECVREVQRRVSEHFENSRMSYNGGQVSLPRTSSTYGLHSSNSASNFRESHNSTTNIKEEGNSLEKLLHPRRSRKRLEQMKEREEAQKREMEQFREFIRTTEMRITPSQGMDDVLSSTQLERAKSKLDELADPLLPLSLLQSSPLELIELVCVLFKHGREQEKQIEEAKNLVTAAIEARKDAESTAREAVELTLVLDARLDRIVRQEMNLVSQARKQSAAGAFRHTCEFRESNGSDRFDWQVSTPSSSSMYK